MKYIDLFAGVGGFRNGINKAHFNWKCVYSNEWNKYANSVYRRHYGKCDDRDIKIVPTSDIPDHDLLVGGFPCQSFSVAGKRAGFDDTRGTLFFEIARILRDKRPRYFLLENVKGLLSHDTGKTFQTILGVLSSIGYGVQWMVLNSKDFGVPQNRERIYIVGHLRGTARPQVFPIYGTSGKTTQIYGRVTGLKGHDYLRRVYSQDGASPTLPTGTGGNHHAKVAIPVLTPDRAEKRQNGRRFKTDGEPAFTLTSQDKHGVSDGVQIRRLTPLECERLQGFPDNWTQFGYLPYSGAQLISDSQRYKMMGNAVTTNVVTEIVKKLLTTMDKDG